MVNQVETKLHDVNQLHLGGDSYSISKALKSQVLFTSYIKNTVKNQQLPAQRRGEKNMSVSAINMSWNKVSKGSRS